MRTTVGSLATLASLAAPALCWGEFGHEITATIAQIHLYPSAREAVCNILPGTFKCNLAGVAAWPDMIKLDPESKPFGELHFVNGRADHPPDKCSFRDWTSPRNILSATVNRTRQVADEQTDRQERDHALRFLVHFLGDLHQPFHLAGRDTGGNDVKVEYNGRGSNIHTVWDTSFIESMVLHLPNYTSPLPTTPDSTNSPTELELNTRIESALHGSPYDAYIRWILIEGVQQWWADEVHDWTTCPKLSGAPPTGSQMVLEEPGFEDPIDLPVCPYYWASQTRVLLCGLNSIWPPTTPKETNKSKYGDRVRGEKIIEKQLALGGIRLAGVLNALFGSEEDKARFGAVPSLF